MKPYEKIKVPDWLEPEIQITEQLNDAQNEIAKYDYIGIKIAMGVATVEDYAEEIEYTESIRIVIRELESKLEEAQNEETEEISE